MFQIRTIVVLILCFLFQDCKDEPPFFQKLNLPFREETNHFHFYCEDALDATAFTAIKVRLENNYAGLLSKFQLSSLPKIRIAIWTDRDNFYNAQNNRYPGSTGYITGKEEARLLYLDPRSEITAVHEFVHLLTLFVKEDFDNKPRWLWESIAVFEAGQFVEPKSLPYMVSGNYPSLDELDQAFGTNQKIYQVGYTLAEFIVTNWDYDTLITLIKSNGNIQETLHITTQEFESQWYDFVNEKYLK